MKIQWKLCKKCYGKIENTFEKLGEIRKTTATELRETHFVEVMVKKFNKIFSPRLLIKENFENFTNYIKFYKKLWKISKFQKILDKL